MAKFNVKALKPYFINNFHDNNKETQMWIGMYHFYNIAKSTNEARKAGNKRFTKSVKNMTLYKAMWCKANTERYTNQGYNALLEKLDYIDKNPEDNQVDWTVIRTGRKQL
jgi:hypothetical protein